MKLCFFNLIFNLLANFLMVCDFYIKLIIALYTEVSIQFVYITPLRICQFVLEILSGNEILTSIKGQTLSKFCEKMTGNNPKLDLVNFVNSFLRYSIKILRKMTGNNPKLDPVNVDVHTTFGQILSIPSQAIERKLNSDVNQGP